MDGERTIIVLLVGLYIFMFALALVFANAGDNILNAVKACHP